ncbi:hypothetical protein PENSPDRAFT_737354 [Peniophora sp. CONT]|nr:hypothetical protein PENSPDRAFT_737354 [Peniophora sp. CONT]
MPFVPPAALVRRAFQTAPPGSDTSFFTSGASPPIIIGFICLGAFTFGVITVALWRRRHMRQSSRSLPRAGQHKPRKPMLHEAVLDVGSATEGALAEKGHTRTWRDIMPISAMVEQPTQPQPEYEAAPGAVPALQIYTSYQRWRQSKRRNGAAMKVKAESHGTVQATVLLAMPSPKSSGEKGQEEMVEYALGTHAVRVYERFAQAIGTVLPEGAAGVGVVVRGLEHLPWTRDLTRTSAFIRWI